MAVPQSLRRCLGDIYMFYFHTHIAHWNLTGPDFPEKHKYLNDLYDELWEAVDDVAEHLRPLGIPAPPTLAETIASSAIVDRPVPDSWEEVRAMLLAENDITIQGLQAAFMDAQAVNNQGLMNFLADRLDRHAKIHWFLTVSK